MQRELFMEWKNVCFFMCPKRGISGIPSYMVTLGVECSYLQHTLLSVIISWLCRKSSSQKRNCFRFLNLFSFLKVHECPKNILKLATPKCRLKPNRSWPHLAWDYQKGTRHAQIISKWNTPCVPSSFLSWNVAENATRLFSTLENKCDGILMPLTRWREVGHSVDAHRRAGTQYTVHRGAGTSYISNAQWKARPL